VLRSVPAAVLGSLLFLVIAPGSVAGFLPWAISRWQMRPPLLGLAAARGLGVVLIALGLPMLLNAFARFALQGRGTPAPVAPTERLVVQGPYRFVRNPMYVAVTTLILGQALLLGDPRLLAYGSFVWLSFHLFVVLYEEPTLRRRFGPDYDAFRTAVPRWIPRVTPWDLD
jgi:protein-S-isoprenylcysteine O-methyltransferase Ste14